MPSLDLSASLRNSVNRIKKITIKIPSEIKQLKKVSSGILEALSSYNVDEAKLFDIKLCIEEAVRNAIVHGNRCDKSLTVKIDYWVEDDKFALEVEDQGSGFDHTLVPDPTSGENILRNSGRGVYLIKRLMDKVEYNQTGNKVRMVKRLK